MRVLQVGPKERGGINSVLKELDSQRGNFIDRGVCLELFETRGFKKSRNLVMFFLIDIPRFLLALMHGVDVVHFHVAVRGSFYRKYVLFLLSKLLLRKTVFHMHSGEFRHFYSSGNRLRRCMIEHFVGTADEAIGVSRWCVAELRSFRNDKTAPCLIGNSASVAEAACNQPIVGNADSRRYIAFVGKLTELKGLEDLLAAISILKKRGIDVELRLAGDGDRQYWRARAAVHDIEDRLHFMGWLDDDAKFSLLRAATLFCIPSHFESFGIATLEAMLFRLPAIGTRLGGYLDLIVDGETGFLVEPKDPQDLAQRIEALLADSGLATRMGRAAKTRALSSYSVDVVVDQYAALYQRLI
jgi:glycosyltransferase involved in cell wall biosynthesis